jgi:hypothetical protein
MEFAYEITVNGAEEAKAALASIATAEDKRNKNMQQVLPAIKEVARDLDNLGLNVGKTFTMASEGALSVVAAIGSGGMAGAIGLATLAVGALAQAWVTYGNAHKRAEEEAKSRLDAFKDSMSSVRDIIKEMQKPLTSAGILEQEQEILERRIAQEHAGWDLILLQDELFRLKRAAAWAGPASALYEKAIEAQEKKIADFREHTADQTRITMGKIRKKQEDEEQLAFEAQAKRDAENAKKSAEKVASERASARSKAAEAELAHLQKLHDADLKMSEDKWTEEDKKATEFAAARARREAFEREGSDKYARERYEAARKAIESSEEATKKATEAEKKRREELAKTTAELEKKRGAEMQAIAATQLNATVNLAFAATSMVVRPFIGELTATMRELGTVNRENYQEFSLFSDELPAIIAKKTQAILGGIAAEATASALQSTADAARESALGLGLLFIQPQAAAAHFASSGVHLAAASAYGAISGVSMAGAVGIGAMRGGGGPIPLTREEQERQGRDRGGRGDGTGSTLTGRGSDGGSMSGAEPFVVNISYQAGSIAPADENRAARTVASATRRARSNAFDRRRMGA